MKTHPTIRNDLNHIGFVIPGLTRNPVFLDSRFRGNDDFLPGLKSLGNKKGMG